MIAARIRDAIADTRNIARSLSPVALESTGLMVGVAGAGGKFRETVPDYLGGDGRITPRAGGRIGNFPRFELGKDPIARVEEKGKN